MCLTAGDNGLLYCTAGEVYGLCICPASSCSVGDKQQQCVGIGLHMFRPLLNQLLCVL